MDIKSELLKLAKLWETTNRELVKCKDGKERVVAHQIEFDYDGTVSDDEFYWEGTGDQRFDDAAYKELGYPKKGENYEVIRELTRYAPNGDTTTLPTEEDKKYHEGLQRRIDWSNEEIRRQVKEEKSKSKYPGIPSQPIKKKKWHENEDDANEAAESEAVSDEDIRKYFDTPMPPLGDRLNDKDKP